MIIRSGELRLRSSGIDILPKVANVAADEPEMAAKSVQPAKLTCRRPPGSRPSHGDRPRNRSWLRQVRNRIAHNQSNKHCDDSCRVQIDVQLVITLTRTHCPDGKTYKLYQVH